MVVAVNIKNRIPHSFAIPTFFKALIGHQPKLTNLRVFGSRLYVRKLGKRDAKLDYHTYNGIFIGYTITTKNVNYINEK